MDYQLIVAAIIGLLALAYILRKFIRQTTHIEKDPKCEDCPVPDSRSQGLGDRNQAPGSRRNEQE